MPRSGATSSTIRLTNSATLVKGVTLNDMTHDRNVRSYATTIHYKSWVVSSGEVPDISTDRYVYGGDPAGGGGVLDFRVPNHHYLPPEWTGINGPSPANGPASPRLSR